MPKYLKNLDWDRFNKASNPDAFVFSGKPVSWADLAEHFKTHLGNGDPVLLRANAIYGDSGPGGDNNEGYRTGEDLVRRFESGQPQLVQGSEGITGKELKFVGRSGGRKGKAFKNDLDKALWKTQLYETTSAPERPNSNWFPLQEFIEDIQANKQKSAPTGVPG